MSDEIKKAEQIAVQVATVEMIRHLIIGLCRGEDAATSKANIVGFEEMVVDSINSRRHFPDSNDATETYVKEAAAGYVSRVVGSINIVQDS